MSGEGLPRCSDSNRGWFLGGDVFSSAPTFVGFDEFEREFGRFGRNATGPDFLGHRLWIGEKSDPITSNDDPSDRRFCGVPV